MSLNRSRGGTIHYFTRLSPLAKKVGAGVFHEAEVPYVFGNLSGVLPRPEPELPESFDETDRSLSNAMSAAWVRFARTGDPNGSGLPSWPSVHRTALKYLEFGDKVQVRQLGAERLRRLDFLGGYFSGLRRSPNRFPLEPFFSFFPSRVTPAAEDGR